MTQMFVAIADQLARQIEELSSLHVRCAAQDVTAAVRHERERAWPQQTGLGARDFEPTFAGGHDVKHHAVLHRRQVQCPRRRELREAIERPAHAQEVQRLAERIGRWFPGIWHGEEYAKRRARRPRPWTKKHETWTRGDCCS
jgi:hypothetical protein